VRTVAGNAHYWHNAAVKPAGHFTYSIRPKPRLTAALSVRQDLFRTMSPGSARKHRRLSSEEKKRIVLRVLSGESRETVASESDVSPERIEKWESRFRASGIRGLSPRRRRRSRMGKTLASLGPWALLLAILLALVFFLTRLMENAGPD
jgi:hypothetical protein